MHYIGLPAIGVVLALTHATASAATFAVTDLADAVDAAPGNGVCATVRGTCTLRAAVQETNALAGSDEIDLAIGVHELSIGGVGEEEAATGDLDVTDDLTITGANAYLSVIDANGIDRVLDQVASEVQELILRDLTITGGNTSGSDESGGGVQYRSSLNAERIIVTRNVAARAGGGIAARQWFTDPALDLRLSIVSLNNANTNTGDGGGIETQGSDAISIERSIIIANTAEARGGGIAVDLVSPGQTVLEQVIVYGNNIEPAIGSAATNGGGIYISSESTVHQSWIGHNLIGEWGAAAPLPTGLGGGLFLGVSPTAVTNTTIEGNLANRGGGIGSGSNLATITHATIARNRAEDEGGALWQFSSTNELRLEDTILAENLPLSCAGKAPISDGHNLADDASCGLGAAGDLDSTPAQLGALGYYGGFSRTIPPLPGSPAIEGGADAGIAVDQRGVARPQLAQFDIGAVEANRARQRHIGTFTQRPRSCDLDRNGRVDFADLDRLIASFPVAGGRFDGNAQQRLKSCVASCTHAGCPAVALIPKPRRVGRAGARG